MPRPDLGVSDYFYTVTPDDANNLPTLTRAIWVGTAGDIEVTPSGQGGQPTLLVGVSAGTMLYLSVNRIGDANTTASNIVAFA